MNSFEDRNVDAPTVSGFGQEWSRFDQADLSKSDSEAIFRDYFSIFPWELLKSDAVGIDVGCGSGRWAMCIAPLVGRLHVLDASGEALIVARRNLAGHANVVFHHSSVADIPVSDASLDFAYSLGVLHHVPDTLGAIRAITAKLKLGAPILVYLYYAFDMRPFWFRMLWRVSDALRRVVSRMPHSLRYLVSQLLAIAVYWPLARVAKILDLFGVMPESWPLSYYRDKDLYVMRTDALDRFGTRLEHRFTRDQIHALLESAGVGEVRFSDRQPYWCAVGIRR